MTDPLWRSDINRPLPIAPQSQGPSRRTDPAQYAAERPAGKELRQACTEFESVFIAYLLKEMRATVDKSGLIDGGQAEKLYESMMDGELARKLSAAGGLGLAQILCDQLGSRHDSGTGRPDERAGKTDEIRSRKPQQPR